MRPGPLPEPVDPATLPPRLLAVLARRGQPVGTDVQRLVRGVPAAGRAILAVVLLAVVATCVALVALGGETTRIVGATFLGIVVITALFSTLAGWTGELLLGRTWLARRSRRSRDGWQVLPADGVRRVRWAQPVRYPGSLSVAGRGGRVRLAEVTLTWDVATALGAYVALAERRGAHVRPEAVRRLHYRELKPRDERREARGRRAVLLGWLVGLPVLIALVIGLLVLL